MDRKIIYYKVLTYGGGYSNLSDLVIEHINDGWQPLGGICSTDNTENTGFAQAMVKYEDEQDICDHRYPCDAEECIKCGKEG